MCFLEYKAMKNKLLILSATVLLLGSGCAFKPMVSEVMTACSSTNPPFPALVTCIKDTYNTQGRAPNHPDVKSFYAQIDVIVEEYNAKKLTDAQAKAQLYKTYDATVGAGNRAIEAKQKTCVFVSGMMMCD
jgi:hypothetical protein